MVSISKQLSNLSNRSLNKFDFIQLKAPNLMQFSFSVSKHEGNVYKIKNIFCSQNAKKYLYTIRQK